MVSGRCEPLVLSILCICFDVHWLFYFCLAGGRVVNGPQHAHVHGLGNGESVPYRVICNRVLGATLADNSVCSFNVQPVKSMMPFVVQDRTWK